MKRIVISLVFVSLVVGGLFGWRYYQWIYYSNTPPSLENAVLLVPEGATIESLIDSLNKKEYLVNKKSFKWVADRMQFGDESVKAGRYNIMPGASNRTLINMFRLNEQAPVSLIVRPSMTLELMAQRIASQLMFDSATFVQYIQIDYLTSSDYTEESILSLFIPNTYEVYWNISPQKLLERFEREQSNFWNAERKNAADKVGLTPYEVYTLASIVERETQSATERPVIAGLYLNRLQRNMLLQADPTVLYALGDFTIRRVLYVHLEVDSPYNTYKHPGLPPGPIAMPSMGSLLAVLHPADHNYLFFCVKPGGGEHAFAGTLAEHKRNARAYQRWLNTRKIR
jgi:peptidoglycan lytic transglycosylase G